MLAQLWASARQVRSAEFQGPPPIGGPAGYFAIVPDEKTLNRYGTRLAWLLEDTVDEAFQVVINEEIRELAEAISTGAIAYLARDNTGREVGLPREVLGNFDTLSAMFGVRKATRGPYADVLLFLEEQTLEKWIGVSRIGKGTPYASLLNSHKQTRRILQEMVALDAIAYSDAEAVAIEWGFSRLQETARTLDTDKARLPKNRSRAVGTPATYSKEEFIAKAGRIWRAKHGFVKGDVEFSRRKHLVDMLENWSIDKYGEPKTPHPKTLGRYVDEFLDSINYTGPR